MPEPQLFAPVREFDEEDTMPVNGSTLDVSPSKRLMLFAGQNAIDLGARIADRLGVSLGKHISKRFPSGETYVRFEESIRGCDVFLVQCFSGDVNDSLMELLIMADAASLGSAKRVTAVLPLYPYARQDKKSAPREPITARLAASLLRTSGIDRIVTMDLHAGQVQGFFDGPLDHMTALPTFRDYLRDQGLTGDDVCVVSADIGRSKLAKKFAEMLETPHLAIIAKERPAQSEVNVFEVINSAPLAGRVAIISDDMIDTAGTLCKGAEAVAKHGPTRVIACATHPIFSAPALTRIEESVLDSVIVCDTVPVPFDRPDKITVLPVDRILADTIDNIFREGSVSNLFGGENQLF